MKILLIAGHGNGDSGAVGCGCEEYKLTRELANLIAAELKEYATVAIYNQNRNAFEDASNGKFNIGEYDYVLELHFNAFNGNAHGTECYVVTRENGITVEQAIMRNLGKYFTLRDNDSIFDGVKRENFLVINSVKDKGMSGALLEVCFIDNLSDMAVYQGNKTLIAKEIVSGIIEGFGLEKIASRLQILYIPASEDYWRVYPLNKAPIVGNECGYLRPKKFGGLTYDILDWPQDNVVTIQTQDYGKVNIYVGADTPAIIK